MPHAPETFVHLHNHTEFSLLDGASRIHVLVEAAAKLEMPALAITDHGVMYGAIHFDKACKEAGIKPIVGCEVYVAPARDDLIGEGFRGWRLGRGISVTHRNAKFPAPGPERLMSDLI